ncbi:hypothetical protein [Paraburkholderia sp. WSM4175]|uniref:hypothetical protein n=1 Tax=Paraburkholderia sp. WSM4175 TaxID=2991072 RepID=UPI003D1DC0F7
MNQAHNRLPLTDIVRLIIRHEAATQTAKSKLNVQWEREWPLLDKLMTAARSGDLKVYNPGEFQSIALDKLQQPSLLMNCEAYLEDVDAWLDLHESRTPFRFARFAVMPAPLANQLALAQARTVQHSIEPDVRRPVTRHQHQEEEVLRVIRELGHDPKKLPKQRAGHRGIKAAVRSKLSFSPSIFNKAWERLRKSRDIGEDEVSPKLE